MTKTEALAKWSQACPATELKGQLVRNGNWNPLAFALRHKDCEAAEIVTVAEQGGTAILKITPVLEDVPKGKVLSLRPAFHLIVT